MAVKLKGIGWIGGRTTEIAAMAKFYEDVFGLSQSHQRPDSSWGIAS